MNLPDGEDFDLTLPEALAAEDKWVLTKFDHLVEEVTDSLERFDVGVASTKLYDFTWDVFCDWYIELAKSAWLPAVRAPTAPAGCWSM